MRYHEGTRLALLADVLAWAQGDRAKRAFVLTADAGVGKSVLAAVLARRHPDVFVAHHFCEHTSAARRDPKVMLCALARQLAAAHAPFGEELEKLELSAELIEQRWNVQDVYEHLLGAPLARCAPPAQRMVLLVDALDECERGDANEVLEVIVREFPKLPEWLGVFVTTRPETPILSRLKRAGLNPEHLLADADFNRADVLAFLRRGLQGRVEEEDAKEAARILAERAKGIFLYARFAVAPLDDAGRRLTLGEIAEFPEEMGGFYETQLRVLGRGDVEALVAWRLLQLVVAAREPVPVAAVPELLECSREERRKAMNDLSGRLPTRDGSIHPYHKTLFDWLTEEDRDLEDDSAFFVDRGEVEAWLGRRCGGLGRQHAEAITAAAVATRGEGREAAIGRALGKKSTAAAVRSRSATPSRTSARARARRRAVSRHRLRVAARAAPLRPRRAPGRRDAGAAAAAVGRGKARAPGARRAAAGDRRRAAPPRAAAARRAVPLQGARRGGGRPLRAFHDAARAFGARAPFRGRRGGAARAGRRRAATGLRGHSGWVTSVAVAGAHVVSGSDDRTVRVWNKETGELVRTLEGHSGWVRSVAVAGAYVERE